jgi:hypothetical protein
LCRLFISICYLPLMKFLPLVLALLLLPLCSRAIYRSAPAPKLHSVLDSPEKATRFADDNWARRFASGPHHMPPQFYHYKTPPEDWRRRGIGLTIAGSVLLLAGGAGWLASDAETRRQTANGGKAYTSIYYLLSLMIGVVGLVLVCVGLPIWLTHLNK